MVAVPIRRPLQGSRSLGPRHSTTPGQGTGAGDRGRGANTMNTATLLILTKSCILNIMCTYGSNSTHYTKGMGKMVGDYL